MTIRTILKYPDPLLRRKSEPVTDFGPELKILVSDMAETMYDAPGAGLAAPQIGVVKRVVVIDIAPANERDLIVLINPEIVEREGSVTDLEGCLSVIEYSAKVTRARRIVVHANDIDGNRIEFEAEEWFARVIQHEVDHLEGTLYLDHLSSLKRAFYRKKLKKLLEEKEEEGKDR